MMLEAQPKNESFVQGPDRSQLEALCAGPAVRYFAPARLTRCRVSLAGSFMPRAGRAGRSRAVR